MSIRKIELWAVVAAMLAVGFTSTAVARPDDTAPRRAESRMTQSLDVEASALPGLVLTGETDSAEFRIAYFDDESPSAEAEIYFQCSHDAQIATCQDPIDEVMNDGDTAYVWVTFTASDTTGSAQLELKAEWPGGGGQGDSATAFFTVSPAVEVIIGDAPSSVLQYAADDSATFGIVNNRASADSMSFTCVWAGGSCTAPDPIEVGATDTSDVTVHFATGAITGGFDLTLTANSTSSTSHGSDTVSVAVGAYATVTAVPLSEPVYSEPSAVDTAYFFVRFPGQTSATFDLEWSCGGGLTGCPSPSDTTVGDEGLAVPVSYTAGTNGDTSAITLTVTHSDNATITASATLDVIATSGILFTVDDANPGLELNRGDCLNVSAGAISIVCDDVQYVYPFMPVMRMNRPRQVGLIFNGGIARPGGVVGANFVLPPGATEPDSIRFNLDIDGTDQGTWTYVDDLYEPGVKTRVSRPWSWVTPYGTQLRDYVYTMTPFYGASPGTDMIATGHLIDLDHRFTFGVGWWLAGYERLAPVTDSILGDVLIWTGGDASTRAYIEEGADTFVAWTRGRPDTVMVNQDSTYTRHLLGGGAVHFNALGVHQTTEDANGNETHFDYGMYPFPVAIRTATPAGTDTIYKLENDSQGVDLLVRDEEGGWNEYRLNMTACEGAERQITSIVAPDSTVIEFAWQGAEESPSCGYELDHVTGVTDIVTAMSYNSGSVRGVYVVADGDTIFTDYEAARTIGSNTWSGHVYKPRPAAAVSAYVNGPLDTYGDSTRFFTTAWGAVRGTRDAYGFETWIERDDDSFPALPTRVRHPNGWELRAAYRPDGLLDHTVNGATGGLTTYAWNEMHSRPDTIVSPEGVTTVMTYDGNGNLLTQKAVGGGTTTYAYDGDGLVIRVKDGLNHRDTLIYDDFGNLEVSKTPLNHTTTYDRDLLGRVTETTTPDGITKAVTYDVMGRVTLEETTNGSDDLWTRVHTTYDSVGRRIKVQAYGDTTDAAQDSMSTGAQLWAYDGLGRVSVQSAGAKSDTMTYDRAGRVLEVHTDRGHTIRMEYDLLSRLTKRVVDSVTYVTQFGVLDSLPLPAYAPGGLTIPIDSVMYTYDAMGYALTIDNRYAHITRSYTFDGLVATDQQAIMNYPTGVFTNHVYDLGYWYNRDRQRVAVQHPTWLSSDPTVYDFDALGRISTITGPEGDGYTYTYDDADRITKRTFPSGGETLWGYDNDNRLTSHVIRIGTDTILHNTMSHDNVGRVTGVGGDGSSSMNYTGLGAVEQSSGIAWEGPASFERFEMDPFGAQIRNVQIGGEPQDDSIGFRNTIGAFGQVVATQEEWRSEQQEDEPSGWVAGWTDYQLDDSGNRSYSQQRRFVWRYSSAPPVLIADTAVEYREESKSFYSADNRLMVHQVNRDSIRNDTTGPPFPPAGRWGAYEEYWYDGLGRRILKRTRQGEPHCEITPRCEPAFERYVWDGDQILWELRHGDSGNQNITAPGGGPQAGVIGYVHGGDVDAPLAMVRSGQAVSLHQSWRGAFAFGTDLDGEFTTCTPLPFDFCSAVAWPAGNGSTFMNVRPKNTPYWYGSLVMDQADATGLSYRRNRYYDPVSGQFTQQDPIGIAGGLNLYGYANGDPINFSDPFGLNPCGPFISLCYRAAAFILGRVGPAIARFGPAVAAALRPGAEPDDAAGMLLGKALRSDIQVFGGRSGAAIDDIVSEANSFIRGGGQRVFETDDAGRVVRDITPDRVKVFEVNFNPATGESFRKQVKRALTPEDEEILHRMGVGNE